MRKVLLIYNPRSGRWRRRQLSHVEAAAEQLRTAGIEATVEPTRGPGSAGEQAKAAIAAGYDTIIACGGDGTVHEALQGVVGTEAAMGVIPLGTGNALANDLRLNRDPAEVARELLNSEPVRVPLGRVEFDPEQGAQSRYFFMVTGVGADAEMLYQLTLEFKSRWGIFAYYLVAARLWLAHEFVPFQVEFTDLESGALRRERVGQILAVHISEFGGILHKLAPGASLVRDDFQLVMFKSSSRWRYFQYIAGLFFQRNWRVRGIETARANDVLCTPLGNISQRVYVETDGELLGKLPVRIRMTNESVRLLTPQWWAAAFRETKSLPVPSAQV